MGDINRKFITYMTLEDATREPGDGFWNILTDRWWSYEPDKGLLFYRTSPQCNRNKGCAEAVMQRCHPDAQLIFVPRVYVRHDCADYA